MISSNLNSNQENEVYVTGVGVVAPSGIGSDCLWRRALSNQTCIRAGEDNQFVGRVSADNLAELSNRIIESEQWSRLRSSDLDIAPSPAHLMAFAAMSEAMTQAGWSHLGPDDGLILATTTGLVTGWESELGHFLNEQADDPKLADCMRYQGLGCILQHLAASQNFSGQTRLITTACAAATQALILAHQWIRSGRVKRCLVGGVEVLSNLTIRGFDSFQLLSDGVCKPFDQNRNGINLAEGAGFLCLESDASPNRLAKLCGGGIAADGYHMTAPDPQGSGCASAMSLALKHAGIDADMIDWIHAHGTGSPHNDVSEAAAILKVFGDRGIAVSSTKAIHGHMLAASGAVESVLCVMALVNQVMLGTAKIETQDPTINLEVNRDSCDRSMNYILKSTLGFGGSNGAVVFSRVTR